jgi:hypothetical protein
LAAVVQVALAMVVVVEQVHCFIQQRSILRIHAQSQLVQVVRLQQSHQRRHLIMGRQQYLVPSLQMVAEPVGGEIQELDSLEVQVAVAQAAMVPQMDRKLHTPILIILTLERAG